MTNNNNIISELLKVKYHDTELFLPPIKYGKVIKVYDGDTITIATKFTYPNNVFHRFSVRIKGIDTPEIRRKNKKEKEFAILAKNCVSKLALNKIVELKNIDKEKYGRILADVYVLSFDDTLDPKNAKKINISEYLLKKKLAVAYNGGTKKNWDEMEKLLNINNIINNNYR